MKKRFITKKKKKKFGYKLFFFFFFFILGIFISYKYIENSKININDKELVYTLLYNTNHHNKKKSKIFSKIVSFMENNKPVSFIDNNYKNLIIKDNYNLKRNTNNTTSSDPIIYIYNTHQTEEYAPSNYVEYSVNPTVLMADYILQETFSKNGLSSVVEEKKIKDILNLHRWNYSNSYKASRILLEDAKKSNPNLKYFIDVHRDSLSKDRTTITINNKSYAKIIFIVGMENENYQENLAFTTKINNKLNEKYSGLSKGILKKGGEGVNGVYNQDFSKTTILIEIGGKDNTVDEVLNTTLSFADCFMEVITENEG